MAVVATLWENANFNGFALTSNTGSSRYFWYKYGAHNDFFSSMRAWANDGSRGNAYAFDNIDFTGRFAALNVGGRYSSAWWSYFGDDFNDVVSSSLVVRRQAENEEIEVALGSLVKAQFASLFDKKAAGTAISRTADPKVFMNYHPSFAPNNYFATIHQDLNVSIPHWFDYSAYVRYHVQFDVANGSVQGWVAWVTVWVESGVISGTVFNRIQPPLFNAHTDITAAISSAMSLFSNSNADVYLLPGKRPDMNQAGFKGNYDDDVVLVVVKA